MEYQFGSIEQKWRQWWNEQSVYKTDVDPSKPKFYVLDMFPYPSGAGLHVGHPLGYIASDIYARYKRQCGYNVLHPMGFDAFGLPAEQYALETGQHPAVTTEQNIRRYREQLDLIGFSYDWDRSFRTSDPDYYKWTQWIFTKLFHSWFDRKAQKARPIEELIAIFENEGNANTPAPGDAAMQFSAVEWAQFTEAERRNSLMNYRLAYLDFAEVWWCEELGTVLANDEVINGVSERGGFPCVRRKMRQWSLRITEYAERLISGLDTLDWTDGMKDMQRAWIGRSSGAQLSFDVAGSDDKITVFTTRPDTIFGADFIVLAPEHPLVDTITTEAQQEAITEYKAYVERRSERERIAEVKVVSGAFTGAYAQHPFTDRQLPIYIAEYVLAGYGTGAIMAVPSGDERDHLFAQHFNIPITNIFGSLYSGESAYMDKSGKLDNSGFLSGMEVPEALEAAIKALEAKGIGTRRVQYKLRDAGFSRQRYWGEPFPVIYKNDLPYTIDEPGLALDEASRELPVELPFVESYRPGPEGQGPLANLEDWVETPAGRRETNTMPGYAGSSWYFLRYMDPKNQTEFASRDKVDYWNQVDVYVGGTEHAVGHLLYSRMWTKALCDLGYIGFDEPFKKLVNQGMIQGSSRKISMVRLVKYFAGDKHEDVVSSRQVFVSKEIHDGIFSKNASEEKHAKQLLDEAFDVKTDEYAGYQYSSTQVRVDIATVNGNELNIQALIHWRPEYKNAKFVASGEKFICEVETEKMSKSKYNVVNPDDIVAQYGADTFRLYEMFLGPIEASKPWDTQGIEGVHRFLRKLWRLFVSENGEWLPVAEPATEAELRIIHKAVKKLGEDIERFGFNTCVSQLMICVNELSSLKCKSLEVLELLVRALASFAPHLAEELWHRLGNESSVVTAPFPKWEERFIAESSKLYPVAINGKTRTELPFALDAAQADIEREVLADETVLKWLEGKAPKKIVFVKGRMINVVV